MTTDIRVPEMYVKELAKSQDYVGLIGLSVGKAEFMNPVIMERYAQFMQDHFAYSVMIIADFPKKYNIMALRGVTEDVAEKRTEMAGNELRTNLERVTRDFPTVKVARWRQFMTPDYEHNLRVMRGAYLQESEFRNSCDGLVMDFLNIPENKARWSSQANPPLEVAKEYVLDELALFLSVPLSFRLPICEIYPGRNEVHERVQNRDFAFCRDLRLREDRLFMEAYYEPTNT